MTYKDKNVNTSCIYNKQTHPERFLYIHVVYMFNVVLSHHKQIPSPTFLFNIEEYKKTICALLCVGIYKGTKNIIMNKHIKVNVCKHKHKNNFILYIFTYTPIYSFLDILCIKQYISNLYVHTLTPINCFLDILYTKQYITNL